MCARRIKKLRGVSFPMTATLILIVGTLTPNRAWAATDVPATAGKFALFCTPPQRCLPQQNHRSAGGFQP